MYLKGAGFMTLAEKRKRGPCFSARRRVQSMRPHLPQVKIELFTAHLKIR